MKKLKEYFGKNKALQLLLVLCGAILFYMLLGHIGLIKDVLDFISKILTPVIIAAIIAYLLYPFVKFFKNKVFGKFMKKGPAHVTSVILVVILLLGFVALIMLMIVPTLIESGSTLLANAGLYSKKINSIIALVKEKADEMGLTFSQLEDLNMGNLLKQGIEWLGLNSGGLLDISVSAGSSVANIGLGLMLALYMLLDVERLVYALQRFTRSLMLPKKYQSLCAFCKSSDKIFKDFFGGNMLDSLIIGIMCYIFMLITKLPYAPLISVIVAVTNFIPTFGPIIGAVIGSFLILLVNPIGVIWFLIYTVISQACDASLLKPLLFGNTSGLRPMWVLIAIIVGGGLFGVAGMILGVPVTAIIGNIVTERTEKRILRKEAEEARKKADDSKESELPESAAQSESSAKQN